MQTQTDPSKRFLNFPLMMLTETIIDPVSGLNRIACFAIAEYAQHCQPDEDEALIQAMYCQSQRPSESLPRDVQRILQREDVDEVTEAIPEYFGGDGDGSEFIANVKEAITSDGISLDDDEAETLVRWCALKRALNYFGRRCGDVDAVYRLHKEALAGCEEHKRSFGPTVWCSVPAQYLFEVKDQMRIKDLPVFRAVAALRSIIGRHRFTGTTKAMISARMIGAKSKAVADHLCDKGDAIQEEFERLQRRRQFDNLLTDVACRGFVVKVGMARRIYLSTEAESPAHLAEMVNKSKRRHAYLQQERAAREAMKP